MTKNKVFGRKPVGVTYWYAQRKKDGKMEIKATYTIQDFTSDSFRGSVKWN
jgi:hypothetical protein